MGDRQAAQIRSRCTCDFDKDFHRERNERLGKPGSDCDQRAADLSPVASSPALCLPCLFGCAP